MRQACVLRTCEFDRSSPLYLARTAGQFPFKTVSNGSVVTIGAFDGLHLGHRELLSRVTEEASRRGLPSVVMSFEPTPGEFFSEESPPARLMRFREKFESLREYGIDVFYCPRFDDTMRDIAADAFVRQIVVHTMNTVHLQIGDDFRFARSREGDVELLTRAGRALGYSVERSESVEVDGVRVSSTVIREALWSGNLALATSMLGQPYRMSGMVVTGRKVGQTLGYPTANVDLRRRQSPVMGIFAVRVSGSSGPIGDGVASVGSRPTFDLEKPLLEVHLFDFSDDLYGDYIHVDFIGRIRDEVKFDTVEELVAQMDEDSEIARKILEV